MMKSRPAPKPAPQRPASPGRKPPVTYVPPTKATPMPMLGDRPPPNIAKPRIGVNPPTPPVNPAPSVQGNFISPMTPKPGEPMAPGLGGGMVPASVAPYSFAPATGMKKGGKVPSASKRADGCAIKGKTRGKMV